VINPFNNPPVPPELSANCDSVVVSSVLVSVLPVSDAGSMYASQHEVYGEPGLKIQYQTNV
jgi:hypothetical protein